MGSKYFRRPRLVPAICLTLFSGLSAAAGPSYGIAMYGAPALPEGFTALPYANPDAPKGGKIVFGETGGFDSLNPYILKGRAPWQLLYYTSESLMGRNWDEPFGLYGLLAQSIETPPDRSWVEFTLRPEAHFSDGNPVTVADVMWSFETLGTKGHPRYAGAWAKVAKMEQTGPRTVRFTFKEKDRELPLILGLRPILEKAQWEKHDFTQSGTDVIPITSAPYKVTEFEPNRYIVMTRDPNYWGKDLALNKGLYNLDEIRVDYFGDGGVAFEAFKAGVTNTQREFNAAKWDTQYDFPAVKSGEVVKSIIPDQRPSGITGFVMNTRRPIFADWRVRDAMLHAFNFEFINAKLNAGDSKRITSYFSNSILSMDHGPATGKVRALLEPFKDSLLPGALEGYNLPVGDGTVRNRKNITHALDELEQAGWTVQDGVLKNSRGQPFSFEILLRQGDEENVAMMSIFVEALKRLGIDAHISTVDSAQYNQRTQTYDFDMTYYRVGLSLSPGNEQYLYWGKDGVTEPGTKNWMGMDSPAAQAMIGDLLNATSNEDFLAAAHALDRVLTTGRYVIPIYQWNISRIAHVRQLHYPKHIPMYGDWISWQPDVWWWQDTKK